MTANLDVLAVGPHPDDVELFCGGTIARLVQLGHRVGIVDLTEGELASNGTVDERRAEASAAAEVLGVAVRENLGLPDGGLLPGTDDTQVAPVVDAIRRLSPELMLIPWVEARHPDHAAAGHLLRRAAFLAGLRKYRPAVPAASRPRVLYYQMRFRFTPSFVVDISPALETKTRAILCHRSQVQPSGTDAAATVVGSARALEAVDARDRYYGSFIGVGHAEPFRTEATLGLVDPLTHFRTNRFETAYAFEALQ